MQAETGIGEGRGVPEGSQFSRSHQSIVQDFSRSPCEQL